MNHAMGDILDGDVMRNDERGRTELRVDLRQRFQHQHECLLGDLRELMNEVMEYSAGIASDNPRLRRKLEDVIDRVDAHERGETELMQRMLYNDIGEGD